MTDIPMKDSLHPPLPPFERHDRAIPIYSFHLLKTVLQERGLNTDTLTLNTGFSIEVLEQQKTQLSFDQCLTIISNAINISGDPALGLAMGIRESLSDLGMLGYAIASCKNGEEAFHLLYHYHQTSTHFTDVETVFTEDRFKLQTSPSHPVPLELQRFLVERDLSCTVKLMREYTGQEPSQLEAHFAYPEPGYVQRYRDAFQCPLVFDTEVSQIVIPRKYLALSNKTYNPVTERMAIQLCDQMLDQQDASRSLISRVRLTLLRTPGNFPSALKVSEQLGMSERSLRRLLKEQGSSFQEIFNEVRKEIALGYLQSSNLTLEDIAQLVGFSDSTSFYRFFKKCTGKAPTAFRA